MRATTKTRLLFAALACLPPASLCAQPTGVDSLDDLAAIADDFQRNARLYRLTANADEAEVRQFLAALERLPAAPHRYDVARVLYIRFVAIDPEAAASHALARPAKQSWISSVFRAWAHVDLNAAVAYAAELDAEAKRVAADAILELDLAEEQRTFVIAALDVEGSLRWASAWASRTRASDDMTAAWHRALRAPVAARRDELRQVAAAWAGTDPAQAMDMTAGLDASLRHAMRLAIVGSWDEDDPAGAIRWLERAAPEDRNSYLVRRALANLARSDLDAALANVAALPAAMRQAALQGVFRVMTAEQSQRAFEHFEALDFADQAAMLIHVAGHLPASADSVAWIESINPKLQRDAVLVFASRTFARDRELALRLTDDFADTGLKAQWVHALAPREARVDPLQAWRWVMSLPDELQDSGVVGAAFATWYYYDRDAAERALLRLDNIQIRDQTLLSAIADFTDSPARADDAVLDRFYKAISSSAVRRQAAELLHAHYTGAAPNRSRAARYARDADR